ncbi:S49 family peptidase [Saezia sanguinis]|uniref:S49 family peptidase n=1 Tax=Saezia sanguinis TaxID=1965230 RepID=UPI003041E613
MNLPHIAQRLFNTPLALHPRKAEVVIAALSDRLGLTNSKTLLMEGSEFNHKAKDCGYEVVEGIAVIPVQGTLVNKLGTLRPFSGMTGYDGIRFNFLSALEDPSVRGICLDIDSPGGEVAGCFDLVDTIYNARGTKPIHAILSESAYSAAYAIASAADRIMVPRTGGVGSIGVVVIHYDFSQRLKEDGIKPTIITCGTRKAESNPLVPLSEEAQTALQADVDATGELFFNTVSRNRGISVSAIRDMEAACFMAGRGVELGLADEVSSPDAAFLQLYEQLEK